MDDLFQRKEAVLHSLKLWLQSERSKESSPMPSKLSHNSTEYMRNYMRNYRAKMKGKK